MNDTHRTSKTEALYQILRDIGGCISGHGGDFVFNDIDELLFKAAQVYQAPDEPSAPASKSLLIECAESLEENCAQEGRLSSFVDLARRCREAADEPSASTGVGDYCTIGPASEQAQKFLLMFEDRDRGVCIYTDEQQARTAFADAESRGWNCHLFGLLRRNAVPPTDRYGRREPPHGYAYRYHDYRGDVLRFNNGEEVNGGMPFEVVPYWIGAPATKEAPPAKGSFGGVCNRASCNNTPATWKHRYLSGKFYCQPCGMWINENNADCYPPLCGPADEKSGDQKSTTGAERGERSRGLGEQQNGESLVVSAPPPVAGVTECGACDKPGEHCSNIYGICSRHGGHPPRTSGETSASLPCVWRDGCRAPAACAAKGHCDGPFGKQVDAYVRERDSKCETSACRQCGPREMAEGKCDCIRPKYQR